MAKVVCGAWECAIRECRGRGVLCQPVALPGSRPQLPVAAFTAAERGRPHTLSHSNSRPEGALAMAGHAKKLLCAFFELHFLTHWPFFFSPP